jgi:hypothetical protein
MKWRMASGWLRWIYQFVQSQGIQIKTMKLKVDGLRLRFKLIVYVECGNALSDSESDEIEEECSLHY